MFKKRSSGGWPKRSTGRPLARAVSKALDKRERIQAEWHPLVTNRCVILPNQPSETCPNSGSIPLWDPLLHNTVGVSGPAEHTEGKLIHRMVGQIHFRPVIPIGAPLTPAQRLQAYGEMDVQFRAGLMKQRAQLQFDTNVESLLEFNPLEATYELSGTQSEGDWTQGRWLRTWDHFWGSEFKIRETYQAPSCCSNVHGGSSATVNAGTWTIASGGINTSVETDCLFCGSNEANTWQVTSLGAGPFMEFESRVPSWWTLKFDIKRKLRMENTDRLDLWYGWEALQPVGQVGRSIQPEIHYVADVKALVGV